jgi:hypothetical protein
MEICFAFGGVSFLVFQVIVDQKVCNISEKCFYCDGYGVRPRIKLRGGLANDFNSGNSNYGNRGNAGSPYSGGTDNGGICCLALQFPK